MNNKKNYKILLVITLIISTLLIVLTVIINRKEYITYQKNYNKRINSIYSNIKEKYPNLSTSEILEIITKSNSNNNIKDFGYDIEKDTIIIENKKDYDRYLIIEVTTLILITLIINIIYLIYNRKRSKDVLEILELIEQINRKNYTLKIDNISEDELSLLKNEIYKTTLTLKEQSENTLKDKLSLKESLEDISHQLRTPLTSIIINIDNLVNNPNLSDSERNKFIRKIKRETYNIKNLIDSILKLSKFDANTIDFNRKEYDFKEIIDKSIENTSTIADLKNVSINTISKSDSKILCDINWEIEAITNIIKNAIEYSNTDSSIDIVYDSNKIYTKLEITNYGEVIPKEEIKHLFERFYKGEKSNPESIGIGLALAKTIIAKDNGIINVESKNNKTTFTIKYFN